MTGGAPAVWEVLVERDVEREMITAALTGCALGRGRVVLLYGPSGLGRSSLVRAAVADAASRDIAVLEASGSELERGYGFGVVRQLLEARIAPLSPTQRRAMLGDAGPAAEAALGSGRAVAHGASASFEQAEGVYRLVSGLASVKPLLVAVDDLQWCDRPSLDFLCFLGHRATRQPICLVAAWRRGEPGVRAGRLQALAGSADTVFLTPAPLTRDGVREVLRIQGERDADDEAVDAIHAQTGGQPFLVNELVAGLRLRGIPPQAGQREAIEAVTPESVRRNMVARLGRQPEAVRRFAQAAAVLGEAPLAQTAALAAIDPVRAQRAADALVRAGFLRDQAVIAFAEPLERSAAYDTLSSFECGALHQRAAALLLDALPSTDGADEGRVAEHLLRSEPAGMARSHEVLRAVARQRAAAGAFAEARRLLARALAELDDEEMRGDTLARLAEIELRAGEPDAAVARASEALALDLSPSTRIAATVAAAHGVALTAGVSAAVALLNAESDRFAAADGREQLDLSAAAATLRVCTGAPPEPAAAGVAFTHAEATAAEPAMLAIRAVDLLLTGMAGAADVRDLCARVLAAGEGPDAAASYFAGAAAVHADGHELVESLLDRDPPGSTAVPDERTIVALALRSQLALARGELPHAETAARAALELIGPAPHSMLLRRIRADLFGVLILVWLERGRCDEARKALSAMLERADAPTLAAPLRIAVALAESRAADALAAVAEVEDGPIGIAMPGIAWRPWAALACNAAGDQQSAIALATAHLDHARSWGGASLLGAALTVRGVIEPDDRRVGLLAEAVAVLESTRSSLALGRAMIELGSALRRLGRRHEARDRLVGGTDLAHRCGADALSARARAELVSLGARPRRAAFSGVDALTTSEHRVAVLAAAGMTNRAIAQELTVSAKTVSGQLTAVYRKLDVHDRAALAAAMAKAVDCAQPGAARERQAIG